MLSNTRKFSWVVDLLLLAAAISVYFIFPESLGLGTRILVMVLFVLSLDLALGYAGIPTLGHAIVFGVGAYAAGLFAVHVTSEPLAGLMVGAVAGATIALISGLLLLRTNHLTLVMISVAMAQIAFEIANQASAVTGGVDGLGGIEMQPLLGLFEFDFYGKTAYLYSVAVVALLFLVMRFFVTSPFVLSCQGIREQRERMEALGVRVYWRLVAMYTISGVIGGIAGALNAQTTQYVSLEVLGFTLSAEAVVMLILGGVGRLYGAILGTVIFMMVHHVASGIDPANWLFVIGAMIIVVVFVAPKGVLSLFFGPGKSA